MAHQFKVGDRVKVKESCLRFLTAHPVGPFTVEAVDGEHVYARCLGYGGYTHVGNIEPVTPAPALIDPAKKYTTRDGRAVRIYATDAGGEYPIHGAIKNGDEWKGCDWSTTGQRHLTIPQTSSDLIEVKPEREGWVNVYAAPAGSPFSVGVAYADKQDADAQTAVGGRIACLHIKFTEGEGL